MPKRASASGQAYDPRPALLHFTEALRQPAGGDVRFASMESIAAHRDAFVNAVHTTWKHIHVAAIAEIVSIEQMIAKTDVQTLPKEFFSWLRYVSRIWRRVNDSIAWGMIGRSHEIRRLCAYRPRPTLTQSNAAAVAAVMDNFNSVPTAMAVWNDATTCLDVGDLTVRRGGAALEFIELKEGKVNEAILELHDVVHSHQRAGDLVSAANAMDAFYSAYGEKGVKQAMRVAKQMMRDCRVMELVNTDRGTDPDLDVPLEVLECSAAPQSYDEEVVACLRRADVDGSALTCVDGCVWIYASHGAHHTRKAAVTEFSRRVFEASPPTKTWVKEHLGLDHLHPVDSLDRWSFVPTALPVFLRAFSAEQVVDLVYGGLMGRVLLFFDWQGFADVVRGRGCSLTWVKPRYMNGREVDLRVGRRTPRMGRSDGMGIRLGGLVLNEVLGSGVRPSSVAAQYAEMLEKLNAPGAG